MQLLHRDGQAWGSHTYLFANPEAAFRARPGPSPDTVEEAATQTLHHFRWLNDTPLNEAEANVDVVVNLLEYWAIRDGAVVYVNSWVTDLRITTDSVWHIMRGGADLLEDRERNAQHFAEESRLSFRATTSGHGQQHLSVVFALVMLLAFFVDQGATTLLPTLFRRPCRKQAANASCGEDLAWFLSDVGVHLPGQEVWEAIARGLDKQKPVLLDDP